MPPGLLIQPQKNVKLRRNSTNHLSEKVKIVTRTVEMDPVETDHVEMDHHAIVMTEETTDLLATETTAESRVGHLVKKTTQQKTGVTRVYGKTSQSQVVLMLFLSLNVAVMAVEAEGEVVEEGAQMNGKRIEIRIEKSFRPSMRNQLKCPLGKQANSRCLATKMTVSVIVEVKTRLSNLEKKEKWKILKNSICEVRCVDGRFKKIRWKI